MTAKSGERGRPLSAWIQELEHVHGAEDERAAHHPHASRKINQRHGDIAHAVGHPLLKDVQDGDAQRRAGYASQGAARMTVTYRTPLTRTPNESAAVGFCPTARIFRPKVVRIRPKTVTGTSRKAT